MGKLSHKGAIYWWAANTWHTASKIKRQSNSMSAFPFFCDCLADHGKGLPSEDYEYSDDDDYDNNNDDNDDDDRLNDRKPFPFFTPVTQYPPVYCKYFHFLDVMLLFLFGKKFTVHFKLNSASIENKCGKWSSITWSWHWIWLPSRSSRCTGWAKSKCKKRKKEIFTPQTELCAAID